MIKYTWNYNGVPDEDFRIDLKTAPRFEKLVYQLELHHAMIDPLRIQQEYLALYNKSTAKTWWGWDFYKSIHAEVVPAVHLTRDSSLQASASASSTALLFVTTTGALWQKQTTQRISERM